MYANIPYRIYIYISIANQTKGDSTDNKQENSAKNNQDQKEITDQTKSKIMKQKIQDPFLI